MNLLLWLALLLNLLNLFLLFLSRRARRRELRRQQEEATVTYRRLGSYESIFIVAEENKTFRWWKNGNVETIPFIPGSREILAAGYPEGQITRPVFLGLEKGGLACRLEPNLHERVGVWNPVDRIWLFPEPTDLIENKKGKWKWIRVPGDKTLFAEEIRHDMLSTISGDRFKAEYVEEQRAKLKQALKDCIVTQRLRYLSVAQGENLSFETIIEEGLDFDVVAKMILIRESALIEEFFPA